ENEIENAYDKLRAKKCDLIAVNNPLVENSGFGTDTNIITLIDPNKNTLSFPKMPKMELALKILEKIVEFKNLGYLQKV
ncbi:MAG: phosphopantothenoylcysteine decarboxylase, partial [Elusimicrobiota bacterium]